MLKRMYLGYGLAVLGLLGTAQYRGWSFMPVDQIKNVPKSVRDNPGSYRSHYSSYTHFYGGK